MKRTVLPVLAILLLCACTSQDKLESEFTSWRERVENVSLTALVTVSENEQVSKYELQCIYTPENTVVEILAPESLKGVTASKAGADTQLEYDGLVLSLGDINGVTPVNALPHLVDSIRNGYLSVCYTEKYEDEELLAAEFAPEDEVSVRVWLNENNVPVAADFVSDKYAGIKIEITDWNLE